MTRPDVYTSASLEVTLCSGDVVARLHGRYVANFYHRNGRELIESVGTRCRTFELNPATVLREYQKRCAKARREDSSMTPEQAEQTALLIWIHDLAAAAREAEVHEVSA